MTKTRDLADLGGGFIQAGSGAVQRTVESKLQDVVSVKDFGAVGNGVTDDTAAIQAAATAASGGALSFEPGADYLITGQITFAADSVVYGNNARLISDQNTPSNTSHFIFSNGCKVYNLEFHLPTGAYAQRFVSLQGSIVLDGCQISSVDQIDDGDDNLDGALQIYNSNDTVVRNFKASKFDKPIFVENSSRVTLDGLYITDYTRGINLRSGSHISVSNSFFNTPSSNAGPNPGNNAIGGSATYVTVENVRITNTGEHGIYFANENYATAYNVGLSISNVLVEGPGQCGIKVRGYEYVQLDNITVVGCAYNNALGTNEDSFRIEACSEVTITGCSGWKGPKVNCGYYGLIINGCQNVNVADCFFEEPHQEGVRIEDTNSELVSGIYLRNIYQKGGTSAVGLAVANGTTSNVLVDNYTVKNPTTGVFNWNAAGGESGDLNLNFKVQGTMPATLETITSGSPKWTVLDLANDIYYSSAKRHFVGTTFTSGNSNDGDLHISGKNATAGIGNYTGGLTFGRAASGRRGSAIAGWQPTADSDQQGLVFLTKSSTTTASDALAERVYLDHLGNVILNMNSSVTPANNGQLMVEATSNTSLTFKYKGSDGVVRSGSITLT